MTVGFAKFFGVLGLSALVAGGAQALTTIDSTAANGGATVTATSYGTFANVEFDWTLVPASAYAKIVLTATSNLFITSYAGPTNADYTGFVVLKEGGPRQTTQFAVCNNTNVLLPIRGNCNLATNQTSPVLTSHKPNTTTAYTTLAAGTYYLGVYESGNPTPGYLTFQVSEGAFQEVPTTSPVPLPAGGLLLAGALGAFGALRRRKKA